MDAILILLMPYNDRFQSDRVVQPFLVNDDRHLVFLTSLHRGVQSFPAFTETISTAFHLLSTAAFQPASVFAFA